MPRSIDPGLQGNLPMERDPLTRLDYQPPNLPLPTLEDLLEVFKNNITDYLLPALKEVTEDLIFWDGLGLLNRDSPLPAFNLFGRPRPSLFSQVSLSSIGDFTPNLLDQPLFGWAGAVDDPAGEWVVDTDRFHVQGNSVRVSADGVAHELLSDPVLAVTPGQRVELTVYVQWVDLISSGEPIKLSIVGFDEAGVEALDTVVASAGSSLPSWSVDHPDADADGWVPLTATFDVPESPAVAGIRMALQVTSGASAGAVWFSDATARKTQRMPESFIGGLAEKLVGFDLDGFFDSSRLVGLIEQSRIAGLVERLVGIDIDGNLDASFLTGLIEQSRIVGLVNQLSGLDANGNLAAEFITGVLDILRIPNLDASKITSGTFAQTRVSGLVDDLSNVVEDITDAGTNIQNTWDRFWDGIFQTSGSSGKTVDDLQVAAASISNSVALAQESAITLANLANAPRNVPFWVSPNPFEDVSFPRSFINRYPRIDTSTHTNADISSTWNSTAASRYNDHVHSSSFLPSLIVGAGDLIMMAIRTTQNRIYNTAGFLTTGANPPATVLMGLYYVDPVSGEYSLVYDFGNISGSITTGTGQDYYDTRVNMTQDLVASEGDAWLLGVLPVGGALTMGGSAKLSLTTPSSIYPTYATSYTVGGGLSALPATITDISLTDAAQSLELNMWACLGQALAEDTTPLVLTENFGVADTGNWAPSSWNSFNSSGSSIGVASHRAYENAPFTLGVNLYWMSSRLAKTTMHHNDHSVEITIGSGWDTEAYGYPDRGYVRCRNNGSAGVAMCVDYDGANARVRITTVTAMRDQVGTVRATSSGPLTAAIGDRFRIEAVGNVYTCYRTPAGSEISTAIPGATWTDSGGVIPQTSQFRSVGFGTAAFKDLFTVYNSASISQFVARDL